MAITRHQYRNPGLTSWRELEDVSSRLARFFDESPLRREGDGGTSWMPAVNVSETKDNLVLTAELPGMSEDDVSVELENNVLTISGEKVEERTEGSEERRYHVWERSYGGFQRSFTLPRTVKAEEITARFDNGVLTVDLPKVAEAKGRKIEISKS
ncbi:MAG: Hsp20/alpha crystallin family protein [Gemmatimonadota bacterium]|nr:Hsp20/alpha crystallin family protein [Gemmatimonadota bacterium]